MPASANTAELRVGTDDCVIHSTPLGVSLYRAGKYQEAIKILQESETLSWVDEGHPQNWIALGMAYHNLGDMSRSQRWLTRAHAWLSEIAENTDRRPVNLQITDWLALNVIRREAEEILRINRLSDPLIAPRPKTTKEVLATQTTSED